ncbi:formyltransferase family protein [Gammaproteobacteria bacterium]|nr:formyltransferase family protein [Gammaproteobacteria bacterium]
MQIRKIKIASLLSENNYELQVLAGYMKKLDGSFIDSLKGKIVNINPSLLPKYGGKGIYVSKVCKGVLKNREYLPGVNVHLVNSEYDKEEILSQPTIPISGNETPAYLAAKAHRLEHHLLIRTIKKIIEKNRSTRNEKKTK